MAIEIKISKERRNEISPLLFGNFIEHLQNCIIGGIYDSGNPLSNENGIRADVLAKCKELAPSIVRFPGGTMVSIYHWEDHVGPVSERRKGNNVIWGGRLCHEFGTAEFVEYCREIGAEPMICINMSTGTLQEAANWVEYCNGTGDTYYANLRRSHGYEEPFNVKYWCIGNEVTTPPDIGWQHHLDVYVREAWEYCKYMKLVDPSIRLILSGGDEDWNCVLLDRLYDMCDYISLHYYSATPDYEEIKRFEKGFLAIYEKQVDEYNKKEVNVSCFFPEYKRTAPIRISLDEWNLWYKNYDKASGFGLQTRYEWKAALWVAAFLNMIIRHSDHIGIANMAQMVNVIAPIVATKEGSYYQTIFYPMRNYRRDCGSYFTHASYECDGLDVCATVGEDGQCVVFAVNTLDTPLTLDFESTVEHISVAYSEDQDQINTMEKDVVKEYGETPMKKSVTVPKYSISTIKLI